MALDRNKATPGENGEMGRYRIVRYTEPAGDLTRWQAVWLMLHKEAESLEPCRLGKGRECINGNICYHASRIIDRNYHYRVTGSDMSRSDARHMAVKHAS